MPSKVKGSVICELLCIYCIQGFSAPSSTAIWAKALLQELHQGLRAW